MQRLLRNEHTLILINTMIFFSSCNASLRCHQPIISSRPVVPNTQLLINASLLNHGRRERGGAAGADLSESSSQLLCYRHRAGDEDWWGSGCRVEHLGTGPATRRTDEVDHPGAGLEWQLGVGSAGLNLRWRWRSVVQTGWAWCGCRATRCNFIGSLVPTNLFH
jgi:hypothetical protein